MKLAILSLPKTERDKLMQTLLAGKAKGDLGLIRACGLDPEVFDRQFLTVCISRDLRSTSVSLHKNEMEMLWSMNQLDALIESGSREPLHVRKAGTFDGDMDAARETAAKVMDEARREAGYRGETREDLRKWLIETGRLPADCDDLMEPLIERQETLGRKENTGRITGDVGPQLLTFIYEEMKIDREWSIREERNLTWWGHRLAQRIWAETVIIEDGDEIVRVHAETDVLRNVNAEAHPARTLSILNRNASLSAYVWNPQTKKISLRSSTNFHAQNFHWLSVFFLSSVSLQAAEAHLQPYALAKLIGGEVDESAHPKNGFREKRDEMLDVIKLLYAPEGNNPSRFTKEDFHAAMKLNPSPWLMANEDEKGLTAEFPFPGCMPPTALLKVDSETQHPQLGSGLLILLRLPLTLRGADVESLAARLNLAELRNTTRSHFIGSWCVDSERNLNLAQHTLLLTGNSLPVSDLEKGAKEILSFCSFIPSACHRPGLLENIIYLMGCRTMWANEHLASEEGVPAEFGPRHSGAFQEQSVQHLSLIKRVLDSALHQIKKKPN
jgi:hypothetical protein